MSPVCYTKGMTKRIILIACTAIAGVLLFWYSSTLQDAFYVVVNFFSELVLRNELLAVVVFVLLSAVAALISPFTNIPLIPIAVVIWGTIPTAILLLGGWMLGDILAYFIGRDIGYPAVRYMVSSERFDRWVAVVREHTSFLMALLLRVALPAELGYAFGIIRYPMILYVLITFLAELPIALVAVYASEAALAGDVQMFFAAVGVLVALIAIGAYYVRSKQINTNHV